jgi:hypothetical protein
MVRIVEVNFRNKKHLECCDALLKSMSELEDTNLELMDVKKEIIDIKTKHNIDSDADTTLDTRIQQITEKHQSLHDQADVCGCFKDDVEKYKKNKNAVE